MTIVKTSTCSSSTRPSPRSCCASCRRFDIDHDKINVNGGAIAMGHPLGATGAMILGTALDELERTGKCDGAHHALCIGGGMGTATIIERV
jgi:acetyl-CoA C-acetyltransferase